MLNSDGKTLEREKEAVQQEVEQCHTLLQEKEERITSLNASYQEQLQHHTSQVLLKAPKKTILLCTQ